MTLVVLSLKQARRLALARAGLLKPEWTGLPSRASGSGVRAHRAAHAIIARFGYLQLDTVSIAGARSHALVLMSRLDGFNPELGERLLRPEQPLFEYWGHEASWIPMELYGALEFRRREFCHHPWWGDVIGANPEAVSNLRKRIRDEGALRSIDMEGRGSRGWWDVKHARRVATALWSSGELAIRERSGFQRSFDLTERVIPEAARLGGMPEARALETLLLRALEGHGWATTGTLAATWRLRRRREQLTAALARLVKDGRIITCALDAGDARRIAGWIRPEDRELAERHDGVRPRRDHGVLLSPFDPVLWDRGRVSLLFGFDQILEIYKPEAQRRFGYYCMPVLAGERLVSRVDLKADRTKGRLRVLSCHFETEGRPSAEDRIATDSALSRHAGALGLTLAR